MKRISISDLENNGARRSLDMIAEILWLGEQPIQIHVNGTFLDGPVRPSCTRVKSRVQKLARTSEGFAVWCKQCGGAVAHYVGHVRVWPGRVDGGPLVKEVHACLGGV